MTFVGRSTELRLLEECFASSKPQLFVLYGRRRVGKTELLTKFCAGKPAIYFTASQTEIRDNLDQFAMMARQRLNDPALDGLSFQNIESLLAYLVGRAAQAQQRLVIVLDEFPYWVMGDKAIPSMIQRFWDTIGKTSNIMLILCGSSISMMIEHTLAERAPLYGRRTGQLELKPLDYRTAGQFFPLWSALDKARVYGVLGGIPGYLEQFDPDCCLNENMEMQLLRKGRFLNEEASFLLQTELRDPKTYTSILRAIAGGNTVLKDLASKVGLDARAIATYLANLQSLHLVRRETSFTEPAPEKSRKGRYRIQDNFLNFWYRFVEPNITLVETHQNSLLLNSIIEPQMSAYMGPIFEALCRQFVLLYGREIGLPAPKRVGRIWDRDFDVDIVAETTAGDYIFGECKWSAQPVDAALVYQLKERARKTGLAAQRKNYFVLFSAGGFKGQVDKDVILVDPTALFV